MSDPTFFFSHARQDRETPGNYLQAFFDDLEIKLAQWAGINLDDRRLGTIDRRIPHGANWDEALSRGLRTNHAMVVVMTPLYFNRVNCGKELMVFLRRHPQLGIDVNGSLTGVENVLTIRWLPESAYIDKGTRDALIPPILRLIEDTPADRGRDEERSRAIERYRRKGMEKCVKVEPHYGELLDMFVARIRDLGELPPAVSDTSFATTANAFAFDWQTHFDGAAIKIMPLPEVAAISPPVPLTSIVVFYITRRPFTPLYNPMMRDPMIAEAAATVAGSTDPLLASLLADARAAATVEGFTIFHAASAPPVPVLPGPLLARLAGFTSQHIVTALMVDPALWSSGIDDIGPVIDAIARSPDWPGVIIVPEMGGRRADLVRIAGSPELSQRVSTVVEDPETRIAALRQIFINARGRVLRAALTRVPGAETVPFLRND